MLELERVVRRQLLRGLSAVVLFFSFVFHNEKMGSEED